MTAAEIEALVMELSNESIQRRGYFPVACTKPLKLGQVVNDIGYLPYPVVVIGETTEEDFLAGQEEAYARCPQRWLLWSLPEPNDYKYFFYKVTAE